MTSPDKDDRGPDPAHPSETPRGALGDARPDEHHDPRAGGGQKPEKIEDRPMVGEVNPDEYPAKERRDGDVTR